MKDLESCNLCEWRCNVNRQKGQQGICGIGIPQIATSMLHPAPPASYDAFLLGCNFRCLGCQNYTISMLQEHGTYLSPQRWAEQADAVLASLEAKEMGADRLFFTGGEPTCSLPWVEAVAEWSTAPINFDTNGFMTTPSLKRILSISDSLTFDIKAVTPGIHRLLTGAPVDPVLRNCTYIIEHAPEKIYEFRVVVYPHLIEEAKKIAAFLVQLSEDAPLHFIGFRPNFVLDSLRGASLQEMHEAVSCAQSAGLHHVTWSGIPDISGLAESKDKDVYEHLSLLAGCRKSGENRVCTCVWEECPLCTYTPVRRT